MRISDWSSDVCSSDLRSLIWAGPSSPSLVAYISPPLVAFPAPKGELFGRAPLLWIFGVFLAAIIIAQASADSVSATDIGSSSRRCSHYSRSEEHTSELQSLMRISYAVFCLKKKKKQNNKST